MTRIKIILILTAASATWAQVLPFPGPGMPATTGAGGDCGSFAHCILLTTDHSQAGASDSSGFPVLVYGSDTTLKDTSHGGYVSSSSGADVLFFSDKCVTQIPSELPTGDYNNTSGVLWAWVGLSTLHHSTNDTLYLCVGNASPPSRTTGAWNSNYKTVWHLDEQNHATDASTDYDSTGNSNNLTNHHTTYTYGLSSGAAKAYDGYIMSSASGASGQVGAYADLSSGIALSGAWTLEFWVTPPAGSIGDSMAVSTSNGYMAYFSGSTLYSKGSDGVYGGVSYGTFNAGTFYHFVLSSDSSHNVTVYKNGNSLDTISLSAGATVSGIGGMNGGSYMGGAMDEVRLSNTNRSADYALASYNSQNNPGNIGSAGFLTWGTWQ